MQSDVFQMQSDVFQIQSDVTQSADSKLNELSKAIISNNTVSVESVRYLRVILSNGTLSLALCDQSAPTLKTLEFAMSKHKSDL